MLFLHFQEVKVLDTYLLEINTTMDPGIFEGGKFLRTPPPPQ